MSEIKLSLSIELRGSTILSKEECLKTTHKVIEKKTKAGKIYKKTIEVKVEDWDKMEKHTMRVTDKMVPIQRLSLSIQGSASQLHSP